MLLVVSVIPFFNKRVKETFEQVLYPFLIAHTVKSLFLNCYSREALPAELLSKSHNSNTLKKLLIKRFKTMKAMANPSLQNI